MGKWFFGPRPMARLLERVFSWMMPMVAHHLARARYVEERPDQLVADAGLTQYVLLGAGMDSVGSRRPDLADTLTIFEVDHPGTQKRKRQRLAKLGLPEPPHVKYVAVDFETQALADALTLGGFDSGKPSFFAWLGVVPYLSRESIVATLEDIATCALSGSEIVFDTLDRSSLTTGKDTRVGRKLFRVAARMGEPMISGFDSAEIRQILEATGFETLDLVTPQTFKKRWFGDRPDGLAPWEYVYVVRARVR
jgi:methyltransferase (TIGR00027 family)